MYCTLHYYVLATLWGRPIDGDMLGHDALRGQACRQDLRRTGVTPLVTIDEAAALIAGVRRHAREAETWADLGSGNGIFTRALATLLPAGSMIHAMDHDARALKEIPPVFGAASIVTHVGDFTSLHMAVRIG